jgi:hypothetical protein
MPELTSTATQLATDKTRCPYELSWTGQYAGKEESRARLRKKKRLPIDRPIIVSRNLALFLLFFL